MSGSTAVGVYQPMDLFKLPERVVLDLQEPIQKFLYEIGDCSENELCVDEVVSEVLAFITEDYRADAGITALKRSVLNCFVNGRDNNKSADAICVSNAAGRLGRAMLDQVRLHRLYARDGVLHYDLDQEWLDQTSPMLVRHVRIPPKRTG